MKFKIPILDKYYGGSYIGGLIDTYGKAATVVSAVQFLMLIIILYTTSAKPYIEQYVPWLTFPMYLCCAFTGGILMMAIARVFIVPSSYTFFNKQIWGHTNPIRNKLEDMERNQERLERNQSKIMEKLGIKSED